MNKWKFPDNNYGQENGIDSSDVETFKKDPEGSLAREIVQNSIDANIDVQKRVIVEFKEFQVHRSKIPGIEELTEEIEKCYEFQKNSPKEEKPLKVMLRNIKREEITCLRISDFNTKGLIGVSTNSRDKPFYLLTKASGISNKEGTTGGSKGIGKFASFVISTMNTVFYYTKTVDNEEGYIGVSKLRSRPLNEKDEELLTQGIGYYSSNDKNHSIQGEFRLDECFNRNGRTGTDLYIIGFDNQNNWKSIILSKILESFMCAIVKDNLEVHVGDTILNSETLESVIVNEHTFLETTALNKKDILAQYELLTEKSIIHKELEIIYNEKSYGFVSLYAKKYNRENESQATKRMVIVRYPFMRIKHKTGLSVMPYSGLCIINNNDLNSKLRLIENPQHTDWETKRLSEHPSEMKEAKGLIKTLENKMKEFLDEVLISDISESVNITELGSLLPAMDNSDIGIQELEKENLVLINFKRNTVNAKKTKQEGKSATIDDFGTGDIGEEEIGGKLNKSDGESNPNDEKFGKDENSMIGKGNDAVLKKNQLSGMVIRNIMKDRQNGEYDLVFKSIYEEENCEIIVKMVGESKDTYDIIIISASINGDECEIQNGKIVNVRLEKDKKYKISYKTNKSETFASEVIINANR